MLDPETCCSAAGLRSVKSLLWGELAQHLRPAERDEVKRALGWSLVAENEALFAEAEALADILGDVQISTAAVLERHKLFSNPNRSMVRARRCMRTCCAPQAAHAAHAA